ncbi:MAG: hypothetical protein HGA75_00130 [Thiobacillus sp.]|nr:hypothetical protein [Thiobacillus sp.]
MLAVRLLLGLAAIVIVLSLLGYGVSRDSRWLRFAGLSIKAGLALLVLIMLVYLLERLLLVI